MSFHARHVLTPPGEVRVQVKFRRHDLLFRSGPLTDPHAAAKRQKAGAQGLDPGSLQLEVPGLPIAAPNGFAVGPTLLDMLVRASWRFSDLPAKTQQHILERRPDAPPPNSVIAWSARDLATLWPKPGKSQRLAPRLEFQDRERVLDHPFLVSLASGGAPTSAPAPTDEWLRIEKLSTCQIGEYVFRVACGMFGSIDDAHRKIAEDAAAAWEVDLARALELWEHVQSAPGGVLIETPSVEQLRPICSISQEIERNIMREACRWFGVDPELDLRRPRGRPRSADKNADQGQIIRVELQPNGSVRGSFLVDFEGVPANTSLHDVGLHLLVSVLGALRTRSLDTDAALLEAWLDAAVPDWRERVVEEEANSSRATAFDPYDVLGVRADASMEEVTAAFRKAMKAVHPDTSGGASTWLSRAVLEAYKTIRAARSAQE